MAENSHRTLFSTLNLTEEERRAEAAFGMAAMSSLDLEEPEVEPESLESIGRKIPWMVSTIKDLKSQVEELWKRLDHTEDIQAVQRLLNRYTALHDNAVFDLRKRKEWEGLFAVDGVAVYPFGSHKGREGKGEWAFGSVSFFERCQLLSSNFDISFSDHRKMAHVRTNCIAQWVKKKDVLDDHFDEGGFYYWTLRKEWDDGKWYIEHVHLTIVWTAGDDPSGVGPKDGKQGEERGGEEKMDTGDKA